MKWKGKCRENMMTLMKLRQCKPSCITSGEYLTQATLPAIAVSGQAWDLVLTKEAAHPAVTSMST